MDQAPKFIEVFTTWLHGLHLAAKDPVLLFSLALSIFAILIAFVGLRRARKAREASLPHLKSAIDALNLKVGDLNSRFSTMQTNVTGELRYLREWLNRLENGGVERRFEEAPPRAEKPRKIEEAPAKASLATGLEKTRQSFFSKLRGLFQAAPGLSEEFFRGLEELLIASDLGVQTTTKLLSGLREKAGTLEKPNEEAVLQLLKADIREILESERNPEILPTKRDGLPVVVLVVGVNGVGKTTTIAKLAHRIIMSGKRVMLAAGDTFRAAAGEQLDHWARRVGAELCAGAPDAKPSTVAYQAIHRAKGKGCDVLIVDTAGRLHTRVNLMNELSSILQIISREQPGAPHETILVLDASTGQNALQQARDFNEICTLTGIIITKLDGTPKGGIVVAIKSELGVPIRYIGVGEGIEDLKPFSAAEFVEALFLPTASSDIAAEPTARGKARRKRRSEEPSPS